MFGNSVRYQFEGATRFSGLGCTAKIAANETEFVAQDGILAQIAEAARARQEVAHDEQGPFLPDHFEGAGRRAKVSIAG